MVVEHYGNRDFFDCNSVYHKEGDINIGAIFWLGCTYEQLKRKYTGIIPTVCAIGKINEDASILKNLKLGFTMLNICKSNVAQRLLQFLPDAGGPPTNTSCRADTQGLPWYDVSAIIIQVHTT